MEMSPEAEAILDDLLLCAKLRGSSKRLARRPGEQTTFHSTFVLDNPDGPAAADRIEAMDREITALRADVTRLTASLAAAEAEAGRLREALKPFAATTGSENYIATAPDYGICAAVSYTAGDYRRARAALSDPAS